MFEKLIEELSCLDAVEAIALGGSRAGESYDASSDYDVYVYCTRPVDESLRREILSKYCSIIELGNQFWELEDNCRLLNGVEIDILYRDLDSFTADVASVGPYAFNILIFGNLFRIFFAVFFSNCSPQK